MSTSTARTVRTPSKYCLTVLPSSTSPIRVASHRAGSSRTRRPWNCLSGPSRRSGQTPAPTDVTAVFGLARAQEESRRVLRYGFTGQVVEQLRAWQRRFWLRVGQGTSAATPARSWREPDIGRWFLTISRAVTALRYAGARWSRGTWRAEAS